MPASPTRATRTTSNRSPRRYRLSPPAGFLDGQGGLVWWEPTERCWVSARFLLDGRLAERRHQRLAEVVHALGGDGVMTDRVLEALLADRGRTCVSRYAVECPTYLHGEAVVGWDRRRQTYFCHCFDLDHHVGPDEVEGPEYSVGTEAADIPTVSELLARTFSYTVIDDATVAALLDDPQREAAGLEPRQLVP